MRGVVTSWQGATSLSLLSQEPADISCSGQLTTTYIVMWDPSRLEMETVCLLAITRWWDIGVTSQCKISAVSEGQPGLARLGQGEESELASLKCSSRTELGEEVTLVTTIQSSPALGLTSVHDIEIGNNLPPSPPCCHTSDRLRQSHDIIASDFSFLLGWQINLRPVISFSLKCIIFLSIYSRDFQRLYNC